MKRGPILVMLAIASMASTLHAQQPASADPGAIQKKSEETFQYYNLQKKLAEQQQQKSSEGAKTADPTAANNSQENRATFLLNHLEIAPSSELLSPQELSAIAPKYEGRQVSIGDLNKVLDEINHLYESKGFVTAHAVLPPQQITNGIVKITLIEGRVGAVSVANKTHTRDSFILKSVHLESGQILRIETLQQDLFFLNRTTDLNIKAVLQPGATFGTSDVELQIQEPEAQRTQFFFDNAGRSGVGILRLGLVQRYSSVLGFRDPLSVGIYGAAGTMDYFTSYEVPLNHRGARLGANFDDSHIQILSGPTQGYGIAGHSRTSSLRLSQPLVMRPRMQFSTSMSADYITSTLHSQAQRVSDTLVRSLDFAANLDVLDRHGLWSFGNTLTWGYHNLGGTRDFLKYDVSIVRMQNLWWSLTGLVRVTGQDNALNYLPTVEQFQVGGVATVRGYPEGFRIGDRGYTGTVELQIPSLFRGERFLGHLLKQRFREDVFFDTGAVYDSYRGSGRAPGDNRYLTSAGGGFALALSKYFAGHFDWAVPLRNTKGISPVGFHFYLQSNPPLGEFMKKFIEGAYRTLADPAESSPEAATPCDSRCS